MPIARCKTGEKKLGREPFDCYSTDKIKIVCWNDNAALTLGSNTDDVKPIQRATEWVKGKGKQTFLNHL